MHFEAGLTLRSNSQLSSLNMLMHRLRIRELVIVVFTLLLAVQAASFIALRGENVPYWDEWGVSLDLALKARDGEPFLQDLFKQHVNHRIVFTNLQTVISAKLLQWNLHAELLVLFLLASGMFLLIRSILGTKPTWLLAGVAALVFSLRQDWMWAFNSQSYYAMFFIWLVVWCLTRPTAARWLLLALIASVCATYSYANGVTAWGLGVALLLIQRAPRRYVLIWVIFAASQVGLYLLTYDRSVSAFDPIAALVFAVGALGIPFSVVPRPVASLTISLGAIALLWFAYNVYLLARRRRLPLVWASLGAFALGNALLIGVGRAELGFEGAFAVRYTVIVNMFWIAGLVLTWRVFETPALRLARRLNTVFLGVVALLYIALTVIAWAQPPTLYLACAQDFRPPCVGYLHSDRTVVERRVPEIEANCLAWAAAACK